ncbi:hypothetical protein V5O48_013304 [Marasmius crinis-equi]|uniref:Uncharacterized protein n=1 Tax=Marasmius crinis-equi TaxID=585013 RepID=A0ABR3F0F6_9AGAR
MSQHTAVLTAIYQFRKLKKPPSVVDINNPGPETLSAIQKIITLARMAELDRDIALHIRARCEARDEPSTPQGTEVLHDALDNISKLMSFPENEPNDFIKHLEPLLIQVWFKVLDKAHSSWGPWSLVVGATAEKTPPTAKPVIVPPVSYKTDAHFGRVLIRHINTFLPHLLNMTRPELNYLCIFIGLLVSDKCFSTSKANWIRVNEDGFIDAWVEVLRGLVCKRKVDPNLDPTKLDRDEDAEPWLHYSVVDRISKFLVYRKILRHFIRETRRFGDVPALTKQLKKQSSILGSAWERAMIKGSELYAIHDAMEEIGLCSYKRLRAITRIQAPRMFFLEAMSSDLELVRKWMVVYLQQNFPLVQQARQHFISSLRTNSTTQSTAALESDRDLIRTRSKPPIVFVDLNIPGLPTATSFTIVDTDTVVYELLPRYRWDPEPPAAFLQLWRSPMVHKHSVVMLVSFPMGHKANCVWQSCSINLGE